MYSVDMYLECTNEPYVLCTDVPAVYKRLVFVVCRYVPAVRDAGRACFYGSQVWWWVGGGWGEEWWGKGGEGGRGGEGVRILWEQRSCAPIFLQLCVEIFLQCTCSVHNCLL